MRKFAFRLQSVLEVREIRKLLAEEKLGVCLKSEREARALLDHAQATEKQAFEQLEGCLQGTIDPFTVKSSRAHLEVARENTVQRAQDLEKVTVLVDRAREELVARTREHKVLVNLKEKRLREYRNNYWWEQSKLMDEIGTARFNRQNERR